MSVQVISPATATALDVPTVVQVVPFVLTWKVTGTAVPDHLIPTVSTTVVELKL